MKPLKKKAISVFIFSCAIFGVFIAAKGPLSLTSPQCTTMFLHYNLQYRAGDEEIENVILNESLREMIGMFDRHPNWKYSIEVQSYAIEKLLKYPDLFPDILTTLQRQINRGQLELICGVYSSQIINAYPGDPLLHSVRITKNILEEANLTRSRVMLFQEGQYAPGLSYYLSQGDWEDVDTVIISEQQLMDFWPAWQEKPPSDVPLFISRLGNQESYILRYDYLPRIEAGYYHGWNYWSDAELAIEKNDREEGEPEFTVDPERVRDFEMYYANLERHGNQFLSIEEWVQHCIDTGHYLDLGHYQMSTHWGPTKYNTCFTWYGDNSGNVDDGHMLANNYRGRNVVAATALLNETYWDQLDSTNQTLVKNLLDDAIKAMLLAMVTDTTGINPRPLEREYGYWNIQKAFLNCSEVVKIFIDNIPALNGSDILQVDLDSQVITDTPIYPIIKGNSITLEDLNTLIPLTVSAETTGDDPTISIHEVSYNGVDMVELLVDFPGSFNWSKREDDIAVRFDGMDMQTNQLMYCPPLVENLTARVNRTDYIGNDILKLHLPISNGLIFVPNVKDSNTGLAIIHNASQYHLAPRWNTNWIQYMTGKIVMPAPHQFYIINNTNIETAQEIANTLNNNLKWVISSNITGMQGSQYLKDYFSSEREDVWEADEWWK